MKSSVVANQILSVRSSGNNIKMIITTMMWKISFNIVNNAVNITRPSKVKQHVVVPTQGVPFPAFPAFLSADNPVHNRRFSVVES